MPGAIGIDFGSSSSCVSIWSQDRAKPVLNDWGNLTTPSFVSFTDKGRLYGDAAKYRAPKHPSSTVFDFKRLLGWKYSNPDVQRANTNTPPYGIVERHGIPFIQVVHRGEIKEYEIVAMLLHRLKELAELEQGTEVTQAVIAVPSFFTFAQREAIRDAAQIADLHTLKIVDEATAAAVHHIISKGGLGKEEKNVIVLDFGAASLDISFLVVAKNTLKVKATSSNPNLGGTYFDDALVAHFASFFKSLHGKDIYSDPRALQKLRDACERAKKRLSFASPIRLEVDSLVEGVGLYSIITQKGFENICERLFEQVATFIKQALREVDFNPRQSHEVALTGGSSHIPMIKSLVKRIFDVKTLYMVDPDCSVANGAAMLAAMISSPVGGESRRLYKSFDLDIVPHTLGVEASGEFMTPVVPRFAQIPGKWSVVLTTVSDYQPAIVIRVYEGDHPQAKNNIFLGRLKLTLGNQRQLRGIPRIEVTFEIDGNLNIKVTASLMKTAERITLPLNQGRLLGDIIYRMRSEAKGSRDNEEKDAETRRRLAAQTDPESQAYYMLSLMNDEVIESHHKYEQRSPPYPYEGEALFEGSRREYDQGDDLLEFVVVQ